MTEIKKEKRIGKEQIWNIPNILTMFRFVLVPAFVILYLTDHVWWSTLMIALSALSDVLDGKIARKYNMVTDLGTAMDPIADKVSQLAVLLCLLTKHPLLAIPFGVLLIKELITAAFAAAVLKKTNTVFKAVWHGKLSTVVITIIMALHLVWAGIPLWLTIVLVVISTGIMLYSGFMYIRRYVRVLKKAAAGDMDFTEELKHT